MQPDLTNKQRFLAEMAERVTLREGAVGVENVLRALFDAYNKPGDETMDERVLARIARLPVPVVSALCKEFARAGVLIAGSPLRLDEPALRVMNERWGWASARPSGDGARREAARCAACEGTGVAPTADSWAKVSTGLHSHNIGAAPETGVRLAALMHDEGAIYGKDVLVLGGAGAMSAVIALAGKMLSPSGRLARRVVAADPQERNLLHLRDLASQDGLIIGLVRHDTRRSLPADLNAEFDTVVLTSSGDLADLVALTTRASEAAKEDGRVYLLSGSVRGEERLDAQREMLDLGLMFERVTPRFDAHPGAELDLYVLRMVGDD